MLGDPALRLLLFLKVRGSLRRQVRRMRTPRGFLLTLLGLFLLGLWALVIVGGSVFGNAGEIQDPLLIRKIVGVTALSMSTLSAVAALNHRGLFVPREEIEQLFSAPLRRADVVRYRLQVNLLRSSIGALFFGALLMARVPRPVFGFLAVFAGLAALPVLGQALAILSGALERRFTRYLALPRLLLLAVSVVGILWSTLTFTVGKGDPDPRTWVDGAGLRAELRAEPLAVLDHPLVSVLVAPFAPWAQAATAVSWAGFLPWFLVCLLVWIVSYELVARLPIDFRELSLETSANVAERIRRVQRVGGGASAARLSRRAALLRVPWLLGRGPMGAVAWRKACGIVRKARGTLWVSLGVLALLVVLVTTTGRRLGDWRSLYGAIIVSTLGTLYLCGGLRFDFREDFSRIDELKAWPLSSNRLFVAMLITEVLLVTGVLALGIGIQAAIVGSFHYALPAVIAVLPLAVFLWVALDNAAFLLSPIRLVPGQEGGLQNVGRTLAMLLLRGLLLCIALALVGLAVTPTYFVLSGLLATSQTTAIVGATFAGVLALLAVDVGLVLVGGLLLRRFDPARDRG